MKTDIQRLNRRRSILEKSAQAFDEAAIDLRLDAAQREERLVHTAMFIAIVITLAIGFGLWALS